MTKKADFYRFGYGLDDNDNIFQAGIEWVLIEIFSGAASESWAFSTKFWLFLGVSIQWNINKNFSKDSFNPSLTYSRHVPIKPRIAIVLTAKLRCMHCCSILYRAFDVRNCNPNKGAYTNHVDRILGNFDTPPPMLTLL